MATLSVYESYGTEHDEKDETGDDGEDEDENEENEDDDADEENEDDEGEDFDDEGEDDRCFKDISSKLGDAGVPREGNPANSEKQPPTRTDLRQLGE